eukprot:TRINITY_DN1056_c0_g2_i1.p1 TRINITY_DN1056_c0_g2~~TRINITY_DN1056_c0_g2_i1.p1  ORF type:complete len:1121 (+),score=349.36 TRINITY_DN1056_c0_g2_i1:246-3365(+)
MKATGSKFWVERPLSAEALKYAIGDVKHLWTLRDKVLKEKSQKFLIASKIYSSYKIGVAKDDLLQSMFYNHGYLPLGVLPELKPSEPTLKCISCERDVALLHTQAGSCIVCLKVLENAARREEQSKGTAVVVETMAGHSVKLSEETEKKLELAARIIKAVGDDPNVPIDTVLGFSERVDGSRPMKILEKKYKEIMTMIHPDKQGGAVMGQEHIEQLNTATQYVNSHWDTYVEAQRAPPPSGPGTFAVKILETLEPLEADLPSNSRNEIFTHDFTLLSKVQSWTIDKLKKEEKPATLKPKDTPYSFASFCNGYLDPLLENLRVALYDARKSINAAPKFYAQAVPEADLPKRYKDKLLINKERKIIMKGVLPPLDYAFTRVVVIITNNNFVGVESYLGIANSLTKTSSDDEGKPTLFQVEICGLRSLPDGHRYNMLKPTKITILKSLVPDSRMYGTMYAYGLSKPEREDEGVWYPEFTKAFYPEGEGFTDTQVWEEDSDLASESSWEDSQPSTPRSTSSEGEKCLPTEEAANLHGLDPSQRKAVTDYLTNARENGNNGLLHIIEGPPGTGKTRTLVGLVRNTPATKSNKLLVTAPSNTAVQVVATALKKVGVKFVLIGVADKVPKELHDMSPDVAMRDALKFCKARWEFVRQGGVVADLKDYYAKLRKIVMDYRQVRRILMTFSEEVERDLHEIDLLEPGVAPSFNDIVNTRLDIYRNFTEVVSMELDALALKSASIVLTTLVSTGRPSLYKMLRSRVHTMVVDEAAQSTEPELMIPFRLEPKNLVLIGDIKQLGGAGTEEYKKKGYCESSMERLLLKNKAPSSKLKTQYRMHHEIQHFPRKRFYDGYGLEAAESVMKRGYVDGLRTAVAFFDVPGTEAKLDVGSTSHVNYEEAGLVLAYAGRLAALSRAYSIGIITFYADQVTLLKEEAVKIGLGKIHISTVDSFQGGEYDIILLSFVRSNNSNKVGFIDPKRLNVALTRARQMLFMMGNLKTLKFSDQPDVAAMAEDMISRGRVVVADMSEAYPVPRRRPTNKDSIIGM